MPPLDLSPPIMVLTLSAFEVTAPVFFDLLEGENLPSLGLPMNPCPLLVAVAGELEDLRATPSP